MFDGFCKEYKTIMRKKDEILSWPDNISEWGYGIQKDADQQFCRGLFKIM